MSGCNRNANINIAHENICPIWVVFSGRTDISWLKIFKSGFRHCFVVLHDGFKWMSIDPMSSYVDIQTYHHIDKEFDLPKWFEGQGYYVVKTCVNKNHDKAAPWMLFTCVEAVKRILGVHHKFIFTPWQLYRFLKKSKTS